MVRTRIEAHGKWILDPQASGWLGFTVLTIGAYWLLPVDSAIRHQYFVSVALQFAVSLSLAALCSLYLRVLCRWVWEHQRYRVYGFVLCEALAVSLGIACQFAAERILTEFNVIMPSRSLARIAARSQFVITALVCWVALNFALRFYSRAREQARIMQQSRLAARDAQLAALRHQFQPHFLLNALNAVSSLIVSEQPTLACAVLSELKALMKAMFADQGSYLIDLESELDFAQHYLRIQRVRFGNKLDLTIDVEPGTLQIPVPRCFLLSLIENAVKYSLADGASRPISLAVKLAGQTLILTLENAIGSSSSVKAARGYGVGLKNTRDLLWNLYGDLATLDIDDDAARFSLRITLPIAVEASASREIRTFNDRFGGLDQTTVNSQALNKSTRH